MQNSSIKREKFVAAATGIGGVGKRNITLDNTMHAFLFLYGTPDEPYQIQVINIHHIQNTVTLFFTRHSEIEIYL